MGSRIHGIDDPRTCELCLEFPPAIPCDGCGMVIVRRDEQDAFHCRSCRAQIMMNFKAASNRGFSFMRSRNEPPVEGGNGWTHWKKR